MKRVESLMTRQNIVDGRVGHAYTVQGWQDTVFCSVDAFTITMALLLQS